MHAIAAWKLSLPAILARQKALRAGRPGGGGGLDRGMPFGTILDNHALAGLASFAGGSIRRGGLTCRSAGRHRRRRAARRRIGRRRRIGGGNGPFVDRIGGRCCQGNAKKFGNFSSGARMSRRGRGRRPLARQGRRRIPFAVGRAREVQPRICQAVPGEARIQGIFQHFPWNPIMNTRNAGCCY